MSWSDDWSGVERVLCVRLDSLGDLLMTTPAIRALQQSGRPREITVLTSPAGAEAGRLVPEIDEVISYAAPWLKATPRRTSSAAEHAMARRLRRMRFDAAVIFTVYSQSPLPAALLCYLADIPLRLAHCRENPYQLLTHWLPDPEPEGGVRHEVRRQLDLVQAVGCRTDDERLSLRVLPSAHQQVGCLLRECGLNAARPWVVIHPGASAPSRRYPAEHFAEVTRQLTESGRQVVFSGSDAERGLVEQIRIAAGVPSLSLAGCLSLAELVALIAAAPVLIAGNTGPIHIAAATGTPVVDLYALTNPQHTPWAVPSRVLWQDVPCKNCYKSICPEGHHNCLRLVTPDQVVQAVVELTSTPDDCAPKRPWDALRSMAVVPSPRRERDRVRAKPKQQSTAQRRRYDQLSPFDAGSMPRTDDLP